MLELGVKFLLSYFIGSLMGSLIMGKLKGGVDIRTQGSGNAGGTNALRTQGLRFAIGVIIIDIGKGAVGAGIVPGLEIPFVPADPEISRAVLMYCCAAAAVIGHVWPIYHRFRCPTSRQQAECRLIRRSWSAPVECLGSGFLL